MGERSATLPFAPVLLSDVAVRPLVRLAPDRVVRRLIGERAADCVQDVLRDVGLAHALAGVGAAELAEALPGAVVPGVEEHPDEEDGPESVVPAHGPDYRTEAPRT
jgi:hypothetical protein